MELLLPYPGHAATTTACIEMEIAMDDDYFAVNDCVLALVDDVVFDPGRMRLLNSRGPRHHATLVEDLILISPLPNRHMNNVYACVNDHACMVNSGNGHSLCAGYDLKFEQCAKCGKKISTTTPNRALCNIVCAYGKY